MSGSSSDSIFRQFGRRAIDVLRREGLAGMVRRIFERLRRRPQQFQTFVVRWTLAESPDVQAAIDVTVKPLSPDAEELDALLAVWPWARSRDDIRRRLADRRCYIALHRDRVAAWIWISDDLVDDHSQREFELGEDEVYFRDAFTLAEFRGKSVLPALMAWASRDLTRSLGKSIAWSLVSVSNVPPLRILARYADRRLAERVGVAGFVEVFGIRLHYLFGSRAFPQTRRRVYLQRR
jgi:GNAT superfamily N-acetyltransferase